MIRNRQTIPWNVFLLSTLNSQLTTLNYPPYLPLLRDGKNTPNALVFTPTGWYQPAPLGLFVLLSTLNPLR